MNQWMMMAAAFAAGAAASGILAWMHQRGVRRAVAQRRDEDEERITGLQAQLDRTENRMFRGIELAQQRQLQDVYRTGYLQGYQTAWQQRMICRPGM